MSACVHTELASQQFLINTSLLQSYFVKTPPAGRAAEAAAPPLRAPLPATDTLDAALAAAKDAMEAERAAWRTETLQRWKSLRPRGQRIFGANFVPCVRTGQAERAPAHEHCQFHRYPLHTESALCTHSGVCVAKQSSAAPAAAVHEG